MPNSSESVLQTHLGAVRRRWPAGLVAAALVLAVLIPVAIGLPNLYRSSVTLIVDQAPSPLTDSAAGESLGGSMNTGGGALTRRASSL